MTTEAAPPDAEAAGPTRYRDLSSPDRRKLLHDAAVNAEIATGTQEKTVDRARRNVVVRLATIVAGFALLIAGIVMMILPGPGVAAIIVGLGLLARELTWAERLLEYVKKRAKIEELKTQPAWIRVVMWIGTIAAAGGSLYYVFVYR
jgi:cation:H+ antiporter